MLRAVPLLKQIGCDGIRQWIANGDPAGCSQLAVGEPERTEHAVALLRDRMPGIERELS